MIYDPCVILKPENVKIADNARIDSFCKIEGGHGVCIGAYVHIASFCHINAGGGRTILAPYCVLSSRVVIASGMPDLSILHISSAEPEGDWQAKRDFVTVIQSHAVVFAGAIILPGIKVGRGAIVGAGSVVTKDVSPYMIVAGNPAKEIGIRRIDREYAYQESNAQVRDMQPIR